MSDVQFNQTILVCDSNEISRANTVKCLTYLWSGPIEQCISPAAAQAFLSQNKNKQTIFIAALADFIDVKFTSWLLDLSFKGQLILLLNADDTLPKFLPLDQITLVHKPAKLHDFQKIFCIDKNELDAIKLDKAFLTQLLSRRDALSIEFQAQYLARSEKVWGFECLTRFQYQGQKLDTLEVIKAIEFFGLMDKFSTIFFKRLSEVLPAFRNTRISLNLSLYDVEKYDLLNLMSVMLQQTNMPANKITLEFSYDAYFHSSAQAITLLCQLKALGFDMSIDGYKGDLAELTRLPLMIDEVKLSLSNQKNHKSVYILPDIKDIVPLSHNVGTRVVFAEIEQYQQFKKAQKFSTDAILQGYYLAPPVGFSELVSLQLA